MIFGWAAAAMRRWAVVNRALCPLWHCYECLEGGSIALSTTSASGTPLKFSLVQQLRQLSEVLLTRGWTL